MMDNQRESFRVDADPEITAELFHEGRIAPCELENLSAGGARLRTPFPMTAGDRCTLGVRLRGALQTQTSKQYVSFLMEVLEATTTHDGTTVVRLQNTTLPGSPDHEATVKLVFEAHRRMLARRSGADEASPMASDSERRSQLSTQRSERFGKRSLRPDHRD